VGEKLGEGIGRGRRDEGAALLLIVEPRGPSSSTFATAAVAATSFCLLLRRPCAGATELDEGGAGAGAGVGVGAADDEGEDNGAADEDDG